MVKFWWWSLILIKKSGFFDKPSSHFEFGFWPRKNKPNEFFSKSNSMELHFGYRTMYDFHNSTDALKFWTEKRAINKTFLFFIWFWWNLLNPCVLQFHQVSSKLDEKPKSFINSLFSCSEFQSVSRIVKIVHSVDGKQNQMSWPKTMKGQ